MNLLQSGRIAIAGSMLLLSACAASRPASQSLAGSGEVMRVRSGNLVSPNVEIAARDSSFATIRTGRFELPFSSKLYELSGAEQKEFTRDIAEGWRLALDRGAKRVTIRRGGRVYYGVLALFSLPASARGAAAASYRIDIPEQFFAAADNGRIAYVFERAAYAKSSSAGRVVVLSALGAVTGVAILRSADPRGSNPYVAALPGALVGGLVGLLSTAGTTSGPAWVIWLSDTSF